MKIIKNINEKRIRKEKVLSAIIGELQLNRLFIENIWRDKKAFERAAYYDSEFQDELWVAISEGGELNWIDDVDILQKISYAYHSIRELKGIAKKLFEYCKIIGQTTTELILINGLNEHASDLGRLALENINSAETIINETRKKERMGPWKRKN